MAKQQKVTRFLFWGAFAVFLGVSIPHIAWVVRQYEARPDNWFLDVSFWALAVGYAVAIDSVMAWLTHTQSSKQEGRTRKDSIFTWAFIIVLVAISWYLNWVFDIAHDPSHQNGDVWKFVLTPMQSGFTVGRFTPVLLGALPVFTLAYVSILNKVNQMKTEEAKSIEDLETEASEAERRAKAQERIRNAGKVKEEDKAGTFVSSAFDIVKKVQKEARGLTGERKDPQLERQGKVLQLFRDTPDLLNDVELAESAIMEVLKTKRLAIAHFWRLKASAILEQERTKNGESSDENNPLTEQDIVSSDGKFLDETLQELEEATVLNTTEIRRLYDADPVQDTDSLHILNGQNNDGFTTEKAGSTRSRGPRFVSFEDASEVTGYAIETLKRKAREGEIEYHVEDKNRVKVSSLRTLKRLKKNEIVPMLEVVH